MFTFIFITASAAFAGDNNRDQKQHLKEAEKLLKKRNALFSLDLDVQLGASFSNTEFEMNDPNDTLENTTSKAGPLFGATLSVNFLGYGLTSGFQFNSKGFETSTGEKENLNYFNIPLLLYFDFNVTDNIRVDGNLGPYFGLLLNKDDVAQYGIKNFDFGLTGNLQLAYMFNKFIGVLLGGKYEYGGLNNLGSNEHIKKTTTSTFNIYTGLKFEL
jgi:Outer membrane protein beta-barrel domain